MRCPISAAGRPRHTGSSDDADGTRCRRWSLAGALVVGAGVAGPSGRRPRAPGGRRAWCSWSPPLAGGDAVGVEVVRPHGAGSRRTGPGRPTRRCARRARRRPLPGPADAARPPAGHAGRTGSTPPSTLAAGQPGRRVGRRPRPAVRRRMDASGCPPSPPTHGSRRRPRTLTVALPDPATQVQARLVLDPVHPGAGAAPEVRGLTLTAYAAAARRPAAQARGAPSATGCSPPGRAWSAGTTANGHIVTERDMFVALPSRRALSPRDSSDYSVKVCAPTGRCAFAPVWDVGPWNTRDDYWNPSDRRQNWRRPAPRAAAGAGREAGRLQRRQGPVRAGRAEPGRDRPRRRHVLGRPRADGTTPGSPSTTCGPATARWRRSRVDGRVDLRSAPDAKARVVGAGRRPGRRPPAVRERELAAGRGRAVPAGVGGAPARSGPTASGLSSLTWAAWRASGEWVAGARPRTLPTAVSPVLVGTGAAVGAGAVRAGAGAARAGRRRRAGGGRQLRQRLLRRHPRHRRRAGRAGAAGRVAAGRARGGAQRGVPVLLGRRARPG